MKMKEVLEARWKVITFALLAFLVSTTNISIYPLLQSSAKDRVSSSLQDLLQEHLTTSFNTFVWEGWFKTNGPFILGLFAILLGSGLIASEVSSGTLFFLLSKPISRERILLTKYGVSAGLLLAVSIMSSLVIAITCLVLGHPQNILHLLIATVLLWLATLLPLGLSLLFSLMSSDSLRAVIFSLLVLLVLIVLPVSLPNGLDWSLWHFWSSSDAYLVGSFPLTEYLVCLVTMVIPLLIALVVFRRKAY